MQYVKYPSVLITLVATMFFGCGGGDGKGNANANTTPTALITDSQQAADAISAPASERTASNVVSGSSSATATPFSISKGVAKGLFQPTRDGGGMQLVQTDFCTSGSVTFPPADATSGTITFTQCELSGSGIYINGSISFSGTQSTTGFSVSLSYNNFTISDSTQLLASVNGTMSMSMAQSGNVWSTTVTASNLNITDNGETIVLADYSNTSVTDYDAFTTTVSFHYAVTSSLLGGTLVVTTRPAEGGASIVQNFSESYPYTGVIIVIGANNQRVRVTINGGMPTNTVSIEYDLDGDGVYGDKPMESIPWSDFALMASFGLDALLN